MQHTLNVESLGSSPTQRAKFKINNDMQNVKLEMGVRRAWGWYELPDWNITIGAPLKCGSTTIKHFIFINDVPFYHVTHSQVRGDVYFVVRHPVDRFMSLWRQKCRDDSQYIQWGAPINGEPKIGKPNYSRKTWDILSNATPEELMDYIEAENSEPQWTPQTKILGKLDATCIPLENLSDWWTDRGYGDLESARINSTSGTEVLSDDLTQRILTFYAKDVELYNKSKQ